MTRADLEQVPRADLDDAAVGHLDAVAPGEDEAQVCHLADFLAGGRADVLRPAPARLVLGSPDGQAPDLEQLEVTQREITTLVGIVEPSDDRGGLGHVGQSPSASSV